MLEIDPSWHFRLNLALACLLTALIHTIFLVSLVKKLRNGRNDDGDEDILKAYKYMAFSIFWSMILFGIVYAIVPIYYDIVDGDVHELWFLCLEGLGIVFIIFASILEYILLIYRLYQTFEQSIYEIKRYIIYIHGFIILMTLIPICFALIYNSLLLYMVFYVVLILAFIHLIYAFNHRLYLLALNQRMTIIEAKLSLTERQIFLLTSMRKHTILGCVKIFLILAMISNLAVAYNCIQRERKNLANDDNINQFSKQFWLVNIIHLWIGAICIDGTSFCVYLGFTVNQDLYRCLCKLCDNKCNQTCIECTEKKLNAKPKTSNSYILMTTN